MSDFWIGYLAFPTTVAFVVTIAFVIKKVIAFLGHVGFFVVLGKDYPEEADNKFIYVKVNERKGWATGHFFNTHWGSYWFQSCGVCVGLKQKKWRLDNMRPNGVGSLS